MINVTDADPDTIREWLFQLNVAQTIGFFALLGGIIAGIRRILPSVRRIGYLLDDWFGEPARPGVPERPGVMERLSLQDTAIRSVHQKVDPLVDEATRVNHAELIAHLEEISRAVHGAHGRTAQVERMLRRHIRESQAWVAELDARAKAEGFQVPDWPTLDAGPDVPDRDWKGT